MHSPAGYAAEAPEPSTIPPQEFAYGRELTEAGGSLRELTLPPEVMRRLRRDDLGDLRIFNASRHEVPLQLDRLEERPIAKVERRPLRLFPLPEPVSKERPLGGLDLEVERTDRGEVVRLRTSQAVQELAAETPPTPSIPAAYLLDTGSDAEAGIGQPPARRLPLHALRLSWSAGAPSLIARLRIEASDNLREWTQVLGEGVISDLNYEGARLRRDRLVVSTQHRFLRLEWVTPGFDIRLTGVEAEYRQSIPDEVAESWIDLDPPRPGAKPGELIFSTGGPFTLTGLKLEPPAAGLLYTGQLGSRPNEQRDWTARGEFHQYRIEIDGQELRGDPIPLRETRDGYWRIQLAGNRRLTEQEMPKLRARYQPVRVIFVAQGSGPFLLAYGHPQAAPQQASLAPLLDRLEQEHRAIARVLPGPEQRLGEPLLLREPLAWRTWLLWGVLLAGVAALAWMARALIGELKAKPPDEDR